jgi:hypothetical protein
MTATVEDLARDLLTAESRPSDRVAASFAAIFPRQVFA